MVTSSIFGSLCFVGPCFVGLSVVSSFAIILLGKRALVALLFCLLITCDCWSVYFPHVAMGWSAVCDYGFFWSLKEALPRFSRLPYDSVGGEIIKLVT